MKLKPLNNYVVLRPAKADEKTAGGIYLSENSKEEKNEGQIIEISKDCQFKKGQNVIYKKWSGEPFINGTDQLLLLHSDDVLALLTQGA